MVQTAALRVQTRSDLIDYIPLSTAVNPGDVVNIGTTPMIATSAIAVNVQGALAADGVFDVPKDTSTFSAGDPVYWNSTGNPVVGTAGTGCATSTGTSNNFMGYATQVQLTGDTYVRTALCGFHQAATLTSATTLTVQTISGSASTLTLTGLAGSSSVGGAIAGTAGAGNGSGNAGGAVSWTGGAAGSGNAAGGAINGTGGVGAGSSAGGAIHFVGGASAASSSGNGGALLMVAGALGTSGTGVGGAVTITTGAGTSGGTAGTMSLDCGAANSGVAGNVLIGDVNAGATYINRGPLKPPIIGQTITSLGTTQNSTPTSAQLLGGIITQTGATGAGTVTLPSGTTLSTACARTPVVGDSFQCWLINVGGSQTLTITGATGTTVSGTAAVGSGKFALMQFINTGSNTWNIYCLCSA